jgi:hypothetical protein
MRFDLTDIEISKKLDYDVRRIGQIRREHGIFRYINRNGGHEEVSN